jgi:hypothetical protein
MQQQKQRVIKITSNDEIEKILVAAERRTRADDVEEKSEFLP